MKKVILTLAIIAQSAFVFAEKPKYVVKVKHNDVKMYQQASTASPLLMSMASTVEIEFVRKYNEQWSIVLFQGKPGYILTSELYSAEAPVVKSKTPKRNTFARN